MEKISAKVMGECTVCRDFRDKVEQEGAECYVPVSTIEELSEVLGIMYYVNKVGKHKDKKIYENYMGILPKVESKEGNVLTVDKVVGIKIEYEDDEGVIETGFYEDGLAGIREYKIEDEDLL